ncbi:MATE family efflux transporter [Sulfurimonas sp. HSL-1656]|uniref:MATE family efflux transporter n=1 Tax=Thiomicrolovo subterrani TaxID=3131934 RepID=UPI0031FA0D1F
MNPNPIRSVLTSLRPKARLREVLRLALPAAFKHLLDVVQILTDMLMVGFLSVAALAAVGMSLQFMMIINVVITLYVVGGNAVTARLIGARRRKRAYTLLFTLGLLALLLSLPFAAAGYLFAGDFYLLMGTGEDVAHYGHVYFGILAAGFPLIFLDSLFYNQLSAAGDTKSSLYIKLASAGVNALLDYLLIFGHGGFPALGVAGAAYATIAAYALNILLYLLLLRSHDARLHLLPRLNLPDLRRVLSIGSHAALERLITSASFLLFIWVIASYGTAALAGYQVGLRVEGLAFMPGFGFAVAAMAIAGQQLGAKRPEEAYEGGLYSLKVAATFMGLLGLIMVIWPELFVRLFTQDPETVEQASLYLRLVGLSQVPLAVLFVLSNVLRGAGDTRTPLKINIAALWLLRVIPSYIAMKLGFGIIAVYIIMTVETFIKGFIFWKIFRRRAWLKTKI